MSSPSPVNVSQVGGSALSTAASGVQKVGIVGNAAATVDAAINGAAPTNAIWHTGAPSTASAAGVTPKTVTSLTVSNIKAGAGNVYGYAITNAAAAVCWLQFYNTAGSPVLGTSVIWSVPIGGSSTIVAPPGALAMANFSTGIGVGSASVTNLAAACGTNLAVTVFYE